MGHAQSNRLVCPEPYNYGVTGKTVEKESTVNIREAQRTDLPEIGGI